MSVAAIGSLVLQKLNDLLIHDSIAFDNVIDQIEDIRLQLHHMRNYLNDAELSNDPDVVAWASDYLSVLLSTENNIENYVLSLTARGRRNIGFFQRRGFTLFAAFYDSCSPGKELRRKLNLLAIDIGKLEDKRRRQLVDASLRAETPNSNEQEIFTASASVLGRSQSDNLAALASLTLPKDITRFQSMNSFPAIRRTNFRAGSAPSSPGGYHGHSEIPTDLEGPTLIGFNNDRAFLVGRLKGFIPGGVIPLVGPAGSGKTTLVQTIYNLREIKTYFNFRAWIHVPVESVTISQLLVNLLQQLHKSYLVGRNADQLTAGVCDFLMEKKPYLVVLDHVSDVKLWGEMKSAFPNLDIGESKVILITRDQKVAAGIENCVPHRLDKLCDEHSWELLTKKAGLDQQGSQPDEDFKEVILKKCKGCALDIVLLGGLLSTKGLSCDEWKWYLNKANWQRLEILRLCYNDLPDHVKLCLLYTALFPNEVDISVRRLQRLWLAEGFVRRSPGVYEEDAVEECFNDLVQRNLVMISKFKADGSPRRCRLPRAIREYLSDIAHQISLFYIYRDHQEPISIPPNLGVCRLIEYSDIMNYCPDSTFALSLFYYYHNVRSYLSFNFERNDIPTTKVGSFISKIIGNKGFGVLRVLDLEGVYKPILPETLKLLFHLRYLGLRRTFIDHLPKSVLDLPYLETLDLKQTNISSLPDSIWKLAHLRHLNLPGIRLDYKQKKGHSSVSELRTLVGMIIDDETTVAAELIKLHELRELGITCQLSDSKELISLFLQMTNLKSLWLKSKDNMGRPSKIYLLPLSELSQLSHVSLLGNIGQLPPLNEFPPNLKILALSNSQLKDDPMPVLSKLPNLTVLWLLADSYLEIKLECPRNGFNNLRVLKLWMLKKLEVWTVEKGGMPHLKELYIRHCPKLTQLPSQLLQQETLEELTLTAMPDEFVKQVNQDKQRHTMLTINNYKFTPLPWEIDPELWNED